MYSLISVGMEARGLGRLTLRLLGAVGGVGSVPSGVL